jgi:hypothetical protein
LVEIEFKVNLLKKSEKHKMPKEAKKSKKKLNCIRDCKKFNQEQLKFTKIKVEKRSLA